MHETFRKILGGHLTFPSRFDEDAQDLIKSFLTNDPNARLGSGGAQEVKRHRFFNPVDWSKVCPT